MRAFDRGMGFFSTVALRLHNGGLRVAAKPCCAIPLFPTLPALVAKVAQWVAGGFSTKTSHDGVANAVFTKRAPKKRLGEKRERSTMRGAFWASDGSQ